MIEQLETVGNQLAEKHLSSARAFILDAITDLSSRLGLSEPTIAETLSLSVAVDLHADDRGRVAAALAAQRQLADEGVPADARAAKQEQPGNVGDPPAPRADGPQMGVALVHRLPDTPGSPVGIDFHGGIIAQKSG